MKQALWYLLSDFLSAILFLIVYAVSGSARLAAVAVSAGHSSHLVQNTGHQVEPMQWASLGLVVAVGGATILTQTPASSW